MNLRQIFAPSIYSGVRLSFLGLSKSKVKSIFLTELPEDAEKRGLESQKHFSHRARLPLLKLRQDRQSTRRKAGLNVKSFFGHGFSRIWRGLTLIFLGVSKPSNCERAFRALDSPAACAHAAAGYDDGI